MDTEKLYNTLVSQENPFSDYASLKGYGQYGENLKNAMLLHLLTKNKQSKISYDEKLSRMLGGEDFSQSPNISGQIRTWQMILDANPDLSLEDAIKLEKVFLYPNKIKEFNVPGSYLKGHELSHLYDNLTRLTMNPRLITEGVGNKGYFASPRTKSWETTPGGRERFVNTYPLAEQPQERKASLKGFEQMFLDALLNK